MLLLSLSLVVPPLTSCGNPRCAVLLPPPLLRGRFQGCRIGDWDSDWGLAGAAGSQLPNRVFFHRGVCRVRVYSNPSVRKFRFLGLCIGVDMSMYIDALHGTILFIYRLAVWPVYRFFCGASSGAPLTSRGGAGGSAASLRSDPSIPIFRRSGNYRHIDCAPTHNPTDFRSMYLEISVLWPTLPSSVKTVIGTRVRAHARVWVCVCARSYALRP